MQESARLAREAVRLRGENERLQKQVAELDRASQTLTLGKAALSSAPVSSVSAYLGMFATAAEPRICLTLPAIRPCAQPALQENQPNKVSWHMFSA